MTILQKPVINFSHGRFGYKPEAIVIHIAQGSQAGAYSWFNNPTSQASSHFIVGKNGSIWQFVNENDTAWHAGGVNAPSWSLLKPGVNPNFYTIGIEHEGFTGEPWGDPMYNASAELVGTLCRRFNIPLDRNHVIGHYQINSVSRKSCPGTGVDFNKLINLALNFYEDPVMIKQLQDQVATLQTQITGLQSQITSLKSQLADAQATNTSLQQQNQSLLSQLKNATSGNTDAQVQSLRQTVSDLSAEVQRLQQSQSDTNNTISSLQQENAQLKGELGNQSTGNLFGALVGKIFGK